MFELEKAIDTWRASLHKAGFREPEAIEELEGHLRDEVQTLSSEMRPELAFELATRRIGDPSELKRAFQKTDWRVALTAWRAVMALIVIFSIYAGTSFAFVILPVEAGEERARMVATMMILSVSAMLAAAIPAYLPRLTRLRWRSAFIWGPAVLIATIIVLIGTAGDKFLGRNESEEIRGIFVLCSLCLILLSVSVGYICRAGNPDGETVAG